LIPFAALHDGTRYLIEDFAIATTPSLTLTAPQPLSADKPSALLAGVARSVQGFAPLPNVSTELAGIRNHIGGEVLIDDRYTVGRLAAALSQEEYAIVHLATHSVVSDTAANSFLLTYDGRLSMSELEDILRRGRFRRQPVELLTLSACETAVGDERAALGLAGIALKAGARSAVATLWRVQDDAAAALMTHFYASLAEPANPSKAASLRNAQLQLLKLEATAHPAHWAAFMLIGNWL
jgi:CHAT domain-containing protein